MIRTILVSATGARTDESIFSTAMAVARPLCAHLDFYHVRCTAHDAAIWPRHVDFCSDFEVNRAFSTLTQTGELLSKQAAENFRKLCDANQIPVTMTPNDLQAMSAAFTQESEHVEFRLLSRARHSDLVIVGRPTHGAMLPFGLIERLLLESGRPIIISPDFLTTSVTDTVVIGWKETPEAARALAAAMPLLKVSKRIILAHVAEEKSPPGDGVDRLVLQLAWHGIKAETRLLADGSKPVAQLTRVATENQASLLVVGGYGHKPLGEAIFGGVTRSLVEHAAFPVFLVH